MSEIQRYDPYYEDDGGVMMGKRLDGAFVTHADYDALAKEHKKIRELLTEAYQRLTRERGGAEASFLMEVNEAFSTEGDSGVGGKG